VMAIGVRTSAHSEAEGREFQIVRAATVKAASTSMK